MPRGRTFLHAGEGDRRALPGALNTITVRGVNTSHSSFAVETFGASGEYFPRHFHSLHTETFLCLEGRMWLHCNGSDLLLTAGDFVHAPAGTIHTFAFDADQTRLLGILAPDVFEPFFDLAAPTEERRYHERPAPRSGAPFEPSAVADLDVTFVGPPPPRPR